MVSEGRTRPLLWGIEPAAPGTKVSRLELFYDLVFVFAFLNVTTATSRDLSPSELLRGLLILALLWFAWATFAALGNAVRMDRGIMPLVGLTSVAAIFVAAVSIPRAFTGQPRHLPAGLVFAACFLLVRALQVLSFWYASHSDPQARFRWRVLAVPPLVTTTFLLLAALVPQIFFSGTAEFVTRVILWTLAIAVAYGVSAFVRTRGMPIVSAGHWAERYAQIVLIALGESIISLGTGPSLPAGLPLTWPVIGTAALGIATIAGFWWAYFDTRAIAAEHVLHRSRGAAQIALARDAYTFLHLPMIIGIVLFSLGLKRLLAGVADPAAPITLPLRGIDLYVLYGGALLYFLAVLAFQLRTERWTDWFQVTARILPVALIPVAERIPGIAALAVLALVTIGPIAVDRYRTRGRREALRSSALAEERGMEEVETRWRTRRG